jgi:hypothetical protein
MVWLVRRHGGVCVSAVKTAVFDCLSVGRHMHQALHVCVDCPNLFAALLI